MQIELINYFVAYKFISLVSFSAFSFSVTGYYSEKACTKVITKLMDLLYNLDAEDGSGSAQASVRNAKAGGSGIK